MTNIITIGQTLAMDIPEPKYILGPLQPGDVGLLSGADGAGKSWVAMMAGLTVATGVSVGGIFDPPDSDMIGKVIYFAGEDRLNDHARRMQGIIENIKQDGVEINNPNDDRIVVVPMEGVRMPLITPGGYDEPRHKVTRDWSRFEEKIKGYKLVVLDPLRMFHNLEEVDGTGMDSLVRLLVSAAIRHKLAILLVHHASQSAMLGARDDHHIGRGSTELPSGARAVWTLRSMTPKECENREGVDRREWRVLSNPKANHAVESDTRYLKRETDGVLRASNLPDAYHEPKEPPRSKAWKSSVSRSHGHDF